jgi:hypothetical protein
VKLPEDSHIASEKLTTCSYRKRAGTLRVRTIWMTEYLSGVTKFITLIPD